MVCIMATSQGMIERLRLSLAMRTRRGTCNGFNYPPHLLDCLQQSQYLRFPVSLRARDSRPDDKCAWNRVAYATSLDVNIVVHCVFLMSLRGLPIYARHSTCLTTRDRGSTFKK
jgi:hypothetical protein